MAFETAVSTDYNQPNSKIRDWVAPTVFVIDILGELSVEFTAS